MELLVVLLTIPVLLGIGYGAHAAGIFTSPRRETVNAFAYYIALPALLFTSTSARPLKEILSARLLAGVSVAMGGTILLAWVVHRGHPDPQVRSVLVVQSYHTNMAYLGVPLVAIVFGELATARAGLILGVAAILQLTASVSILSTMNGHGTSVRTEVGRILLNPIILAVLAGLVVSTFGLSLPTMPIAVLEHLGDLALPLAVLCVGGSLTHEPGVLGYDTLSAVIAVKILLMPLLAFLVFLALGSDAATLRAGVLMFAMPTAVSTYVFAGELGGNLQVASMNVFATTIVSTASLFVVVQLLFAVT